MSSQIEQLDRSRRRMLGGFTIGYTVWQIGQLLSNTSAGNISGGLILLSLIGWLVWIYYLWQVIRFSRAVHANPVLQDTLNDELVRNNRLKAISIGFVAAIVSQTFIILIAPFLSQSPAWWAQFSLLVVIVSSIVAFIYFERE